MGGHPLLQDSHVQEGGAVGGVNCCGPCWVVDGGVTLRGIGEREGWRQLVDDTQDPGVKKSHTN